MPALAARAPEGATNGPGVSKEVLTNCIDVLATVHQTVRDDESGNATTRAGNGGRDVESHRPTTRSLSSWWRRIDGPGRSISREPSASCGAARLKRRYKFCDHGSLGRTDSNGPSDTAQVICVRSRQGTVLAPLSSQRCNDGNVLCAQADRYRRRRGRMPGTRPAPHQGDRPLTVQRSSTAATAGGASMSVVEGALAWPSRDRAWRRGIPRVGRRGSPTVRRINHQRCLPARLRAGVVADTARPAGLPRPALSSAAWRFANSPSVE